MTVQKVKGHAPAVIMRLQFTGSTFCGIFFFLVVLLTFMFFVVVKKQTKIEEESCLTLIDVFLYKCYKTTS